jgi:signal transduction histidine kinase
MADQIFTAEWLARANRLATVAAALSATVHEVNNALQIISGSAEMLGPGITADVLARRTEAIGGQARRASALLAELSAFARDDGAEATAAPRVELAQIAQRALAMRQYTLARLHIQASFESTLPLPPAAARPRPLLQIVLNLMLNAERALTGRQDARILLRADEGEGRVRLAVEDSGPGPSAEEQARLFEPKGDRATGFLGVGLPVAKWLAEQEGGTLTAATSSLGGGAFILSLRCP